MFYSYYVGGNLPPNNPTYIKRQADTELYNNLKEGKLCYIFDSRQMGKSSLRVNVTQTLQKENFACANIDISGIGTNNITPDQWYRDIAQQLLDSLVIPFNLYDWWENKERQSLTPLIRLSHFIEKVLLTEISENIVIFIDEIDSVLSLDFSCDDFFAFIRKCYQQRVDKPNYNRLNFVFLGVATPSVLIQDKKRTPFNIGKAIKLTGFTETEALPLAKGLEDFAEDSKSVIKRIIYWTNGQPFLTQKLCQLVLEKDESIVAKKEQEYIDNLVKEQVINNWEDNDEPQHLRTIRDRLFKSHNPVQLLELYKKVLKKKRVDLDKSDEQIELRLSGLVINKERKLKVYNPIYKAIFNCQWVKQELNDLRSHQDKILKIVNKMLIPTFGVGLLLGITPFILERRQDWQQNSSLEYCHWWKKLNDDCLKITSGDRNFFNSSRNYYLIQGIEKFKQGYYHEAKDLFTQAIISASKDPIPQIYYNNTHARLQSKGDRYKIAVVVPADSNEYIAKSIIRGVANAQSEFNHQGGKNGRLLEIVLVNDGDEPKSAEKIAKEIVSDQEILGVIGHYSSDTSAAALPIYEKTQLAMISPTSLSSKIDQLQKDTPDENKVFFRTVPNDTQLSDFANYIKNVKKIDKVVVFYEESSKYYSQSGCNQFIKQYQKIGGKVDLNGDGKIDLHDEKEPPCKHKNVQLDSDSLNAKNIINQKQIQGIVIIASAKTRSMVINIAKKVQDKNIPIFTTGAILYNPDIFQQGGLNIDDITINVPEFSQDSDYYYCSNDRWQEKITHRTATAYDATKAFIESIKQSSSSPTRKEILKQLKTIEIPESETSGKIVKFKKDGNIENRKFIVTTIKKLKELDKHIDVENCPKSKSLFDNPASLSEFSDETPTTNY